MKHRKNVVPIHSAAIILFAFFLSGCARYQYVTVEGELPKTRDREFLLENDSLKITYNFKGWNAPLNIQIENKSERPFYINWQKSAVILDGKKYSLWMDRAEIQALTSETTLQWNNVFSTSSGSMQGALIRDEQVSFIPPRSEINLTPVNLRSDFIPRSSEIPVARTSLPTKEGRIFPKLQLFEQDNSPVNFRTFLTISSDQNFNNPVYLDNHFWVGSVMEAMSSPNKVTYLPRDQYYMRRVTGFGNFTLGVAAITVLVLAVIVGANNSGG